MSNKILNSIRVGINCFRYIFIYRCEDTDKSCLFRDTIINQGVHTIRKSFLFPNAKLGKTTLEEYNYMTKGFMIQLESSLDMKKGYSTNKEQKIIMGSYEFNYIKLLKNSLNNKVFVGYIVIAKSASSGNSYTYAIPENNSELMTKTYVEINWMNQ